MWPIQLAFRFLISCRTTHMQLKSHFFPYACRCLTHIIWGLGLYFVNDLTVSEHRSAINLATLRAESLRMKGELLTRGIWMSVFQVQNSLQAIQRTSEWKPDQPLPFSFTVRKGLPSVMILRDASHFVVSCIPRTNSRRGKKYLLHHAHLYAQAYSYLRVSCLSGWRSVIQKL